MTWSLVVSRGTTWSRTPTKKVEAIANRNPEGFKNLRGLQNYITPKFQTLPHPYWNLKFGYLEFTKLFSHQFKSSHRTAIRDFREIQTYGLLGQVDLVATASHHRFTGEVIDGVL
jgi:hypothetical protein